MARWPAWIVVLERGQLGVEVRPAHRLGLGRFGAEELLRQQERHRADYADHRAFARQGVGGWDLGVEICVHGY